MNKYFALRKTNRMRTKLLTEESQEQLKEVIRYLRRVSWDFCGIELVRSDLLDIAIQANAENQELFDSISDAKRIGSRSSTILPAIWVKNQPVPYRITI